MLVWEHSKSIDLLKVGFNYEERGYKVMYLIAEIDNRYEKGKNATFNMRTLNGKTTISGEQILIGDVEYKLVCRKCYKKRVKKDGEK